MSVCLEAETKCRTCMGECSAAYHQLYDYVDENYKILEMLDDVVPQIHIKATESSNFSHLLCQLCVDKLLTGYKFQKLCIETDKQLHEMLKDRAGVQAAQLETELERALDPLTAVESVKMKQEPDDGEKYECEINPQDIISATLKSDDNCESESDELLEGEVSRMEDSTDTDSSNEKLSVIKERKLKMSSKECEPETATKINHCRSSEFPCTECGKVFDRSYNLKRHVAAHVKKRTYDCDICKSNFDSKKNYCEHLSLKDPETIGSKTGSSIFNCEHCPESFDNQDTLILHAQVHTQPKDKIVKKRGRKKGSKNKQNSKTLQENTASSKNTEDINFTQPPDGNTKSDEKPNTQPLENVQTELFIKEEIDQLFRDNGEEYQDGAEWFNNEEDSDFSEFEDEEQNHSIKPEFVKNLDFVDTGIGEIKKPNTRNRRNGNYPCEVCGKVFDRPYRLKRHSSVHSKERQHACEFCKYRFSTANLLKIHLMQHESETGGNLASQSRPDGFKCPDCPRRFEKQASLSAHRQIHTRNAIVANYPCVVCQRNFMSVRSLTDHIINKHPEVEKHKCDQCVLHAHLVEHLNRHKGNKNLVCLICEKEFGYTNTLKEHMRTHSGESPFLCPQCGKTFRSSSNLRQHMERHFGLKKYQCSECPSRFNCRSDHPYVSLLIQGVEVPDIGDPDVFMTIDMTVDGCSLESVAKHFPDTSCIPDKFEDFLDKLLSKTEEGRIIRAAYDLEGFKTKSPFLCPQCGKTFRSSSNLRQHMERHFGLKKYQCSECPSRFNCRSDHPYVSLLIQGVEVPDIGDPDVFMTIDMTVDGCSLESVAKHFPDTSCIPDKFEDFLDKLLSKTEEGRIIRAAYDLEGFKTKSPFLCPQCGKTFRSSSNLRQHMERHFGLKKYQCSECPSRFNCRSDHPYVSLLIQGVEVPDIGDPDVFMTIDMTVDGCSLESVAKHFPDTSCIPDKFEDFLDKLLSKTEEGRIIRAAYDLEGFKTKSPFLCPQCGKTFRSSSNLRQHMERHFGLKKYQCSECPSRFNCRSDHPYVSLLIQGVEVPDIGDPDVFMTIDMTVDGCSLESVAKHFPDTSCIPDKFEDFLDKLLSKTEEGRIIRAAYDLEGFKTKTE